MKLNIFKSLLVIVILGITVIACEGDMESIHEEYLQGEKVYAGKLDSLRTETGFKRVKIIGDTRFLGNSRQVIVEWEDQSRLFDIPDDYGDEFEIIVDNLVERSYEFDLFTKDPSGNKSVKQVTTGRAVGDLFKSSQLPRRLTGFLVEDETYANWADKAESEYVIFTEISYDNNAGGSTDAVVNPDDASTLLVDWKPLGNMEITSAVISGEMGFDTIYLDKVIRQLPEPPPTGFNQDWTFAATVKVSKDFPDGPGGAEGSLKVIDNDFNSKFLIFDYPTDFWMQQDLPNEEVVDMYSLTSGNDAPSRDPKDWTLVGSNDEVNWVTLDTRTGESFANRNETVEYTFDNSTAYKHYRINITANNGDGLFQLSEWRLFETGVPFINLTADYLQAITVSKDFPDGPGGAEGSLKVVDGDLNSKFLIFDYPTDFWMQQELVAEVYSNQYTLTSGNDAPSRDPRDWELVGSNDGATWVTLDTRTGETFADRNETREFNFNFTVPYKYYRLNITANNGDGLFQLSEWTMLIVE